MRRQLNSTAIARAGLSLVALAAASPAWAQAAQEPRNMEEIVVTAQKREERLQDVPISISVQSGDQLEAQGIDTFNALQTRVPNLSITDTPANASIFIRGIGTSGNNLSFEQSVALFVDGVYGGRNRQFMQPYFDVERIEVLRGPQGALFGRNTSAGAISVTTRRPTNSFEGSVHAEYETVRESYVVQAAVSGPVTDQLSLRLAARYGDTNGWIDNTVLGRKEPARRDFLIRGSALWDPSDKVSVFAKVEYGDNKVIGAPFEFVPTGTRPDYKVDTDDGLAPLNDISDALNATVQADIDLGEHTLTSISNYSHYEYDQAFNIQARRPARLVTIAYETFDQYSQEVRLSSPVDKNYDYIVGGYIEHSKSDIERISLLDLPPPPLLNGDNRRTFVQETNVAALFGQLNWSPIEQIKLGAGIRWTRIEKEGSVRGVNRTFNPNGTFTDAVRLPLDANFEDSRFEPTLTAAWQPNRDVTLYAKYAVGSKGGAFTESATRMSEFILLPERAQSFEVGGKFLFPSIGGSLNIAAFTTDYKDLQKSTLEIATATFITSNAAGARSRGVEFDGSFRPIETLRISVAGAYLDATYTDFPNGACRFGAPVTCLSQDRKGDRLQNSPEWTGNLNLDFNQPLSDSLNLLASWTTSYQSDINYQDILHPLEEQKAFTKTDVRVGLARSDRTWEVALLVRNLFDEKTSGIIFQTFPVGVLPTDRVHIPDPRRSFTLQARFGF